MQFSRKDSASPGRKIKNSRRKMKLIALFLAAATVAFVAGETLPASAQSAPTVSRVSASSGPLVGGQTVTITGKDFTGTTGVDFGAVAATDFAVMNDKQIVATVPNAASAGKVLVEVTNATGANTTGANYEYKAPKITKIEPAFAAEDTAKWVTITGEGLLGAVVADVVIGGDPVTDIYVISDKQIVVETPIDDTGPPLIAVDNGETDVVITRNSVATTPDDNSKFLFTPGIPTITDIEDSGDVTVTGTDGVDVGETLTIVGTNLYAIKEVKFGTSKVTGADITLTSATEIDVEVPSKSAGPVDIIVSNASGESQTNLVTQFSFLSTKAPTIKTIYPEALDEATGGTILVTGTGLTGVTTAKVTLTCVAGTPTVTSATSISDKSLILVLSAQGGSTATDCTVSIENPTDNTLTSDDYDIRYL